MSVHTIRNATLCLALAVGGCGSPQESNAPSPVRPAKLIEIQTATDERSLTLPVVIEAQTSTQMTFQVGGLLASLSVSVGSRFSKGTRWPDWSSGISQTR